MNFVMFSDSIKRCDILACGLLAFFVSIYPCVLTEAGSENQIETCQWESMTARCRWNSEVIVMASARWGRMRTGRCMSIHPNLMAANGHDPLFFGCSADVLSIMDRRCSGRSECDVRMTDPDLDNVKPCYPDLTRFMEASFTCVRVVQESRTCKITVTDEEQYISSSTNSPDSSSSAATSSSSCGAVSHPWRLEAAAGQRINISLIDFAASSADRNGPSRDAGDVTSSCRQYGYVVENSNKKNVSLCVEGGTEQREGVVYTSRTNSLTVVLTIGRSQPTSDNKQNFIVKIQAVGCTNIVPPENAWLRRSENDIIIGCYSSQETWRLKCDGHDWKGHVGTCAELYVGPEINGKVEDEKKDDTKIALVTVVVIAAVAVIICFTIICVGCLCLRRYKFHEVKKSNGPLLNAPTTDNWTHADNKNTMAVPSGTQRLGQTQHSSECGQQTINAQYFVLENNEHDI